MCFMAIDDLDEGSKKDKWFLDSGCSRHMTGDESKFAFLTEKGRIHYFGDNAKGRIIGQGNIDRRQQEEIGEDPKKEESPLTTPSSTSASEFEMSMMGELNFFLGLQIKQLKEGTFINQAKYIRDLSKGSIWRSQNNEDSNESSIKLDKDEKGKSVNSTMYRGMIGHSLVSWHSKKQNSIALSTAEAEYIAVGSPLSACLSHLQLHFCELRLLIGEIAAFRAQGKHLLSHQPNQTKAHRKARYDMTLFSSTDGIATSTDDFRADFRLWLSRRAFVTFSTSLQLDSGSGHRDEVSYLEAFLIDSILTGRRIHVGYLMMMHMISCCKSTTRVLPYDRFLTRVFKDAGLI
ncbi:hypothetical protein CK203_108514 [Vitis vinifera]|uniref:Retrovirus-related Pol polyprotein from transposon TNT 1-94-like beta-barrel domain-containing protein n=1 Tax=Vitis vinifera TaxID=29760 RepID=A0A438CFA5_VITVI|nr:hypothetical protein CK203_108514 [Vitis vinifera]